MRVRRTELKQAFPPSKKKQPKKNGCLKKRISRHRDEGHVLTPRDDVSPKRRLAVSLLIRSTLPFAKSHRLQLLESVQIWKA